MKTYLKPSLTSLFLCLAALLQSCGRGDITKSSQVLARVGDKEITTTYFERQLANLPESIQKLSTEGQGKKAVLEALVNRELLYAAARRKKIDKDAGLLKKFEDVKKELVVTSYLQGELAGKVKIEDREVEAYYNANPDEFKNRQEVRISQIVVKDQGDADEMLRKLDIHRDFGELAQIHSIDKESAARKGDMGWFTRGRLPVEIRDSVFRLRAGEVSKPFKMPDGYEIYKITERRATSYPLEKVREIIKARIFNEKFQREIRILVDGLKKTTTVQVNEALLK